METLKKWLYICSPCIVAMMLALIEIVAAFLDIEASQGYSAILIVLLLPAFLIIFTVDRVTKRFLKQAGDLLLIQMVFLLLAFGFIYLIKF